MVVGGAVVVVGSTVVVVDGCAGQLRPEPGAGHASQQLVHSLATPPLAVQCSTSFFALHLMPLPVGVQHETNPGLPQVECDAHVLTYLAHEGLTRVSLAVCTAHFTYEPCVDAAEQSQAAATAARAAAMSALSVGDAGSHIA
jgi:hypothetical protein